jgi:hypothetical protein
MVLFERFTMSRYLIFIPLPEDKAELAEQLLRSATCFLATRGAVERTNLGDYRRSTRGGASEALTLASLTTENEAAEGGGLARALEGVLRSTAIAAGLRGGEVRVFVASEGADS